ncbi:hypothetical protein T492DRAFT_1090798 [Pavlovales sp. CCMP2436]|nr:hypothetical protein T492DRAFT_1090798 [Pavlovales sp. CCMP2436]
MASSAASSSSKARTTLSLPLMAGWASALAPVHATACESVTDLALATSALCLRWSATTIARSLRSSDSRCCCMAWSRTSLASSLRPTVLTGRPSSACSPAIALSTLAIRAASRCAASDSSA